MREQLNKYVSDVISDMELNPSSLCSEKTLSFINNGFINYITSILHSGMCRKSELRVYRECKHKLYSIGSASNLVFHSFIHMVNGRNGMPCVH